MPRLKSRQNQIPNGLIFYQPETQWKPPAFASFDVIVNGLISHRLANPFLVQKHGWSVDPVAVANEVDALNAKVCQQMGWTDYITDDGGVPSVPFRNPSQPGPFGKLSQLAAGAKTLVKWITSGAEAVAPELANHRAGICVACPLNEQGGLETFFTVPAAAAIRAALEDRKAMNLSTPFDSQLSVCSACSCPLRLKVHMGIEPILADMPQESFDALDPKCWIRAERK